MGTCRYPWEYNTTQQRQIKIMQTMVMRRSISPSGTATWKFIIHTRTPAWELGFVWRQPDGSVSWLPRSWFGADLLRPWTATPLGEELSHLASSEEISAHSSYAIRGVAHFCYTLFHSIVDLFYLLFQTLSFCLLAIIVGMLKSVFPWIGRIVVVVVFEFLPVFFQTCWILIKTFELCSKETTG